jgi:hypothetical protein
MNIYDFTLTSKEIEERLETALGYFIVHILTQVGLGLEGLLLLRSYYTPS